MSHHDHHTADHPQGLPSFVALQNTLWKAQRKWIIKYQPRGLKAGLMLPETGADAITLPDALRALTRLCLLHYAVDDKTTVTKLPQPDARQQEILKALGVTLPAM